MSGDSHQAGLDFSRLRMKSIHDREHKVNVDAVARLTAPGCTFAEWLDAWPDFLGAVEFRRTVAAVAAARRAGRPVVLAYGGHVVKTGCSPIVVDLIERGIVTAVATNGSGAIHDLELAQTGMTSEEVADTIRDGSFGMVRETCEWMRQAASAGADGRGLGRAVGELIDSSDAPHKRLSILAAAARRRITASVHVAIGTDTVHVFGDADGAAIGAATMADFRAICAVVADMGAQSGSAPRNAGGVWLNVGSAVILPEVFLKAVSVAANLGADLSAMHTANFDMLRHYRPVQNVIGRPVRPGHGHQVIGHHEILLPLLRQAVLEELA